MVENEKYNITGMHCSSCSALVERTIKDLNGIKNVSVNLLNNNMLVSYDSSVVDRDMIIKAVTKIGFGASIAENANLEKKKKLV